jgi:hypothetical protein
MKALLVVLVFILAAGCSTTSYKNPTTQEELSITTWFKKVENVSVVRGNADHIFMLEIGSTGNDQIIPQMTELIGAYK